MPGPGVEGVGALVADGEGLAEDADFAGTGIGSADAADDRPFTACVLIDVGGDGFGIPSGHDEFYLAVSREVMSADDDGPGTLLQNRPVDEDLVAGNDGAGVLALDGEAQRAVFTIEIAVQADDEGVCLVVGI